MARRRQKDKHSTTTRGGLPVDNAGQTPKLRTIHADAAGIDIGATQHFVAVPADRDESPVRSFGTFTADLIALADWLQQCGIRTVAMESTGVYWIPLFELLERRGLEVRLVNPHKLKSVPGRKTDVLDCQWIQQLHSYGLLEGSFRPTDQICALRAYVRQQANLVRYAGKHIQHMQKALEQMNLKLTEVVSDITGVTGTQIVEAILAGERDPKRLAKLRDHRCKQSESTIALALEGNWRDEHLFALRQAYDLYQFYLKQIGEVETRIQSCLTQFDDRSAGAPTPQKSVQKGRSSKEKHPELRGLLFRMLGMDMTVVPGLGETTLLGIVSEVGLDMSRWRTEKHFCSWLCLCPGNHKTGGKTHKGKTHTRKTTNRAASLFRMAAQSLFQSKSALGAKYRRLKARLGAPVANTAMAHQLARIFYQALSTGQVYRDEGQTTYMQRFRQQQVAYLQRKASQLGLQLTSLEPNSVA